MPNKKGTRSEECMTFVMKDSGSTKIIRKKDWVDFVRLVSVEKKPRPQASPVDRTAEVATSKCLPSLAEQPTVQTHGLCQEVSDESEDVLPDMVSFDSKRALDDECSLISSVSDRAMILARMKRDMKNANLRYY